MLILVCLASTAAGGFGAWVLTRAHYVGQLAEIRDELVQWAGHPLQEVRTIVARVKALL